MSGVIATQLTDHATRYKTLKVDGLDVLTPYPGWATSYGVMMETLQVTEEGPGGVSSMHFTIWDPRIQLAISTSALVEFWDLSHTPATLPAGAVGRPLFLGFIQNINLRPEGPGRYIDIDCIGVEAVLDWMVVPTYTIPDGTGQAAAVQSLVYNATGIGFPLRASSSSVATFGDQPTPVSADTIGLSLQYDVVVADGSSLRQAIADVFAACDSGMAGVGLMSGAFATVDFYGGLRTIEAFVSINDLFVPAGVVGVYEPADYATGLQSINTMAGQYQTSSMDFSIDVSGSVRGVYIRGANAAGSGLVSDGSGAIGPISYLSDDTSTTAAIRNAIAVDYLSRFALSIRGSFTYDDVATAVLDKGPRPPSYWYFGPDGQTFNETIALPIASISKTFYAGGVKERWTVAVGGLPPSMVKQTRRLTRDVRS